VKIDIKTKDLEITEYIQKLVQKKLVSKIDRVTKNLTDDEKKATLRLKKRSRWGFRVNLSMWLPGKHHIFSEEIHKDLQSALVNLREEVISQIKEYKEKHNK